MVLVCVSVVCLAAVSHADYVSEVMADSPEAYYRFEELPGATNLIDSSGNGHDSLEVSNVVFGAAGGVESAGQFSNAYVQLDLQLSPAAGDFSIEALARFDTTDINRYVASQQGGSGQGRSLLYRTGSGKLRSYVGGSPGTTSSNLVDQDV
jgi:hypothetical protein